MLTQLQKLTDSLSVTIIIEWDNVRLSEMGRCRKMLKNLSTQIQQLKDQVQLPSKSEKSIFFPWFEEAIEILVLYNKDEVDGSIVEKISREYIPPTHSDILLRFLPAPGLSYYQLKNFGSQYAKGDILVFLDSDVIPEEGWLQHLLLSFSNPNIHIVGGHAYIDPCNLYDKTFALAWFFPLRSKEKELYTAKRFFANNVAFRRKVFEQFPFPKIEGTARGSCTKLARTLMENGYTIYRNPQAQVSHPSPNGAKHFVIRALAQGRDRVINTQLRNKNEATLMSSLNRLSSNLKTSFKSIFKNHSAVNLSRAGIPLAVCIAFLYYLLYFLGEMMTHLNPTFMKKHFQL